MCPRCTSAVALHDGQPNVTSTGTVDFGTASAGGAHRSRSLRRARSATTRSPAARGNAARGDRRLEPCSRFGVFSALGVAEVVQPPVPSIAAFDVTHADTGPMIVEVHETAPIPSRCT